MPHRTEEEKMRDELIALETQRIKERNAQQRRALADIQMQKEMGENEMERKKEFDQIQEEAGKMQVRFKEEALKGYDTWYSTILDLASASFMLVKLGKSGLGLVIDPILDQIKMGLRVKFEDKIEEDPKITLPKLEHYLQLKDDNTIDMSSFKDSLRRADEDQLSPADKEAFNRFKDTYVNTLKQGADMWLASHGYVPQPGSPDKYHNPATGEELTKETFEALRNDPATGLNAFLSNHYDMEFSQRTSLAP